MRTLLAQMLRGLAASEGVQKGQSARMIDLGRSDRAIYAVGDVHGCLAELQSMLALIDLDAARLGRKHQVILLGDLIDRGRDSAGVLDLVTRSTTEVRLNAVLGNHERMLLDFFENPKAKSGWLDLGGFETLLSYGLSLTRAELSALSLRRAQQLLEAHIPEFHISWLKGLPHGFRIYLNEQEHVLTHAGYDGARALHGQLEATVLWGRGGSDDIPGTRLVQGHVIVEKPDPLASRVLIDTGAWKTGRLTCLRLCEGHEPHILTVGSADPSLASRPIVH